jgi:pimeloyl-ACP methyl ester carboxylesterase
VSCIEFPFVRGDPSSPSEAGRDYFAGNDVRDAPVVVLHGLLGSAGNWRTMAPKLSTRRRLISVDLRNHGTSPHANDMRFAALAADIVALLDARGVKKAVLLGHSLGGKVALACALLHPERVAGVIAVDMAPVRYQMGEAGWRGVAGIVDALHSTPLQRFRSRAEVDKYLQPLIPDFTTRAFVLQNAVVTSEPAAEGGSAKQSVSWRCNVPLLHAALPSMAEFSLAPEASSAQSLPPFAGPALFVGGGSSPYLRAEAHAATIKSMFPQAELTWIPQAGHWVHVEKPREFVQTVAPWLAKLEQRDDELHELNEQSPPHHQQQGHKQQAAQ